MIRPAVAVAALSLGLAGCSSPPPPDQIPLAPVAGVRLPFPARVMIHAGDGDLDRTVMVQATLLRAEDSPVKDGEAQVRAARVLLAKGFSRVEVNDPSIRPQIVIRLFGKGKWSRLDTTLRVGCGLDAFTADGFPIGSFVGRAEIDTGDFSTVLDSAHAQCLKRPVEQFLASPGLARLAAAGFRDPPAAAVETWMRGLGPMPARR